MMKELYASPEVELLRFAPAENLATEDGSPNDIIGDDDPPDLVIDIGKLL